MEVVCTTKDCSLTCSSRGTVELAGKRHHRFSYSELDSLFSPDEIAAVRNKRGSRTQEDILEKSQSSTFVVNGDRMSECSS